MSEALDALEAARRRQVARHDGMRLEGSVWSVRRRGLGAVKWGYSTGMLGLGKRLLGLAYLIAGVIIAETHRYFRHLSDIRAVASAVLAVVLWPLLLLGINLHIHR